jgi:phage terminase large subunit-like protein
MFEYRSSQNPIGALLKPDAKLPQLVRVVVGVDPSGTSGEEEDSGDDVGIVVAALGSDNHYYVLEDATVNLGPAGWARHAVYKFEEYSADAIVAERNYGGAMVEHTLRTVKRSIPYKDVVATRGKVVRAEPIAALYEQGRVHHKGALSQLEDELCSMTSTGYLGRGSPNRVDALVWALSELHGNQDTYDPELWARLAAKG